MNINDLEKESGISKETIRIYEANGLIKSKKENNIEYYEINDIQNLKIIIFLRNNGYSIKTIKTILELKK
ncbi:MerR family transcriptional regulator [Coprobacillus sp. AF35-8]|nr:MerR family transcriptional regulator [Coprobacillus sp. AF35-8]